MRDERSLKFRGLILFLNLYIDHARVERAEHPDPQEQIGFRAARWICSAKESVLLTVNEGGKPFEKSNGLEISTRTFPFRFASPAIFNASSEPVPAVALKIISPCAAVSANGPILIS